MHINEIASPFLRILHPIESVFRVHHIVLARLPVTGLILFVTILNTNRF